MKNFKNYWALFCSFLLITLTLISCSNEGEDIIEDELLQATNSQKITHSDFIIAERFAPIFFQDVYVTYTETHFFILYSVYHPRDWTDIPFLCALDSHENDMEAVLITANRKPSGGFGGVIDAQTIFHTEVLDYTREELLLNNTTVAKMFIEAKGHGMRRFRGSSDTDNSYIEYYYDAEPAVSPDRNANNSVQRINYNLVPLESTLWLQRNNPQTVTGTALVGNNGDGNNRASTPWGWEDGVLCKNPAQYLKDKYDWTDFSTTYISDTPIQ